jgi:acetyltransferase-like isoleucine patch superfamily enzyme
MKSKVFMNMPKLTETGIVNVQFGRDVRVMTPVNLYGCAIGDECFIGPFVEVQRDATIGARCRIQSHAFICELVSIGDDVFIGHGVMFINDLFRGGGPASGDRSLWHATDIGSRVSIGSNATILPVRICDGCVIGAGAVVTKDLLIPGTYAGNPARLLKRFELSAVPADRASSP